MPVQFIELTAEHGKPILVNVNHILCFTSYEEDELLSIELTDDTIIEVQENYEKVKDMIAYCNLQTFRGMGVRK